MARATSQRPRVRVSGVMVWRIPWVKYSMLMSAAKKNARALQPENAGQHQQQRQHLGKKPQQVRSCAG